MIKLMKFYLFHKKGFRTALSMNSPASYIWTIWLSSFLCFIGGIVSFVFRGNVTESLLLCSFSALLFLASFCFLPEAQRIHAVKMAAKNSILFD
jgi:uncharacterized membrane protein (UPF0136 family)